MKRCSKCRRDQAVRGIRKYKRGDGYQPWCKTCRKDYDHAYWQRNKERWAENKQAWFKRRVEWLREMKTDKACTDLRRDLSTGGNAVGPPPRYNQARQHQHGDAKSKA
jgi:hypothetical protein